MQPQDSWGDMTERANELVKAYSGTYRVLRLAFRHSQMQPQDSWGDMTERANELVKAILAR